MSIDSAPPTAGAVAAAAGSASPTALPFPQVEGVEIEHRFVEARGARFHVAEAGEGPPLVLQHGWPEHWWTWRYVIPHLAERFRVICPDLRGLGWSSGAEGSYRWDELAGDLFAIMDALGHERFRLVSHDWGGISGFRACIMRPERVERFVPLAVVHPWMAMSLRPLAIVPRRHLPIVAIAGRVGLTRLNQADRCLRDWRYRGAFTADETAVYMGALRRPASVRATVKFYRSFTGYEIPRALRQARQWRLHVPTLHIVGGHDPLLPRVPDTYRPHTDDMRVEHMADVGHFISEEAPQELLDRIDGFL